MVSFEAAELSDAWVDGDDGARWRSSKGYAGEASGSSLPAPTSSPGTSQAVAPDGSRERRPVG